MVVFIVCFYLLLSLLRLIQWPIHSRVAFTAIVRTPDHNNAFCWILSKHCALYIYGIGYACCSCPVVDDSLIHISDFYLHGIYNIATT